MSNTYNFKSKRQERAAELRQRKMLQRYKAAAKRDLAKNKGV
jgi:hypothetical protein